MIKCKFESVTSQNAVFPTRVLRIVQDLVARKEGQIRNFKLPNKYLYAKVYVLKIILIQNNVLMITIRNAFNIANMYRCLIK